jgi:hypothetical protein
LGVALPAAVMAGLLVIDRAPDPRRVVDAAAADWNAGDLPAMLRHYAHNASVFMYGRPDDPFVADTLGYWFALGDHVTLSGVEVEESLVWVTFSHSCRYLAAAGIELSARGWFRMEGDHIAASFDQSFASDALAALERDFIAWIRRQHPHLVPLVYEPDTYLGIEWDAEAARVRLDHMDAFFAARAVTR